MDSHLFRLLAAELAALAEGGRLEKIHGPRPGLFVFTLFAGSKKHRLILRSERQNPLLFLAGAAPPNPPVPPARIMLLRKYCADRRLGRAFVDYPTRRLAFSLSFPPVPLTCREGAKDEDREKGPFLLLDLTRGAFALPELPPGFRANPPYPPPALVEELCARPWSRGEKDGPWREFTVLTPLLRESLSYLSPPEGRALLVDLEAGGGEVFFYAGSGGDLSFCSAWPLPQAQAQRLGLRLLASPNLPDFLDSYVYPALTGASYAAGQIFFARESELARAVRERPETGAAKKKTRLLAKLTKEEERLKGMIALGAGAELIKSALWEYPPEAKLSEISLPGEKGASASTLVLNPRLTLRENMEHMFKETARGKRGLAMLAERRKSLLETGADAVVRAFAAAGEDPGRRSAGKAGEGSKGVATGKVGESSRQGDKFKDIAFFQSVDGFVILRGKNARGNAGLIKIGAGHDLWLHAEDAPGAHVLVRRSHAREEVPESTLLEAAALAAEKSALNGEGRVTLALLRHVHSVKGGAPGLARVDEVMRSLTVRMEQPDNERS
ncbi:MAG: NFACT RNA binding domain-containing protein [Desulfovibrio sp.]|nr:NFACT RNA binding domain-containing protein [Desulfovibrio sp.]